MEVSCKSFSRSCSGQKRVIHQVQTYSAQTTRNDTIGVYVHWPFCAQKCPYCDFNSHVRFGGWDEERFLKAYKRELSYLAAQIGSRHVETIFIGGGTPSLMKAATVDAILAHIAKLWSVAPTAEVTIEANPNSVEAQRFTDYRSAGINRASLGVQSLRGDDLKRLGRLHTVEEALKAIEIARNVFTRFSFDLIYARSGQTCNAWEAELTEALGIAGDHLSLYQLTIEPRTPFADLFARGHLQVPDSDEAARLYDLTDALTRQAGFHCYEISNYARGGQECRHNMLYWRYGSYIGVGPGAHGRLPLSEGRCATVTERTPERWVELVETHGHGFTEQTLLTKREEADEMLLMGLRTSEGINLDEMYHRYGVTPSADEVAHLVSLGLIELLETTNNKERALNAPSHSRHLSHVTSGSGAGGHIQRPRIRAQGKGRLVLNEVVRRLALSFEPEVCSACT